jgi:hypothetical protein
MKTEKEKESNWINYMKEYCHSGDTEADHFEADKALTLFLLSIGYSDIVDEFERVKKWYA